MIDHQGREIAYMRVSITDRCNLRCKYCMPEDLPHIGHENILRYEEILRVCAAAVKLGIRRFKITGGEPLVRKGCVDFLRALKSSPGVEWVSITTNGVLLEPLIPALVAMGLDGVNVSLDTLDRARYAALTGSDRLDAVLRALKAAVRAGLRTKLNCVPMREINAGELAEIAAIAERLPVDVRFIELMPTDVGAPFSRIPGEEVRAALLARWPDLAPAGERRGWGPARYLRSPALQGYIGFINALTGHFCGGCNRVRLTSEGFLKLCLYHDTGTPLRELLRGDGGDGALREVIAASIATKPDRHHFGEWSAHGGVRKMSGIGG